MFLAFAFSAVAAVAAPSDGIAAAFASGTIASFRPFVAETRELTTERWQGVREFLERLDCIEIRSVRTVGAGSELELELIGTAIPRNADRERRWFATTWFIRRGDVGT